MRMKNLYLVIIALLFFTGCNSGDENEDVFGDYKFIRSENFDFNAAIVPNALIQEESFTIFLPITEIAAEPEAYVIEGQTDLVFFNTTHIKDQDEYILINDLDTYTYFFILDPGCPDFFDYSHHSYNNNMLIITLDHFHETGVACAAMYSELYLVFKAPKSKATIKVYKYDGSVQCENEGIALDDMEHELTNAGITVYCSKKGFDGLAYPAACGNATGVINIYEIERIDLEIAEDLGFEPVNGLSFYVDQHCE